MTIEEKIRSVTAKAVETLYGTTIDPASLGLEWTKKEIGGDMTLVVFSIVKYSRKAPDVTARELGDYLTGVMTEVSRYEVIKGFLNLFLTDRFWTGFLSENADNEGFGILPQSSAQPVVLEYSSPNTNKPLHLGHIRNNLLGCSLALILKANGHRVVSVNLVNDRGIHICKSMLAYMKWGNEETPLTSGMKGDHLIGKYYVLFDKHFRDEVRMLIAQGMTEEEAGRKAPLILEAQEILRKWEAGDQPTRDLWTKMNAWVYEGFSQTYQRLGIEFDQIFYESDTYLLGREIVLNGVSSGILTVKDDGSIWADLRDEGLDEKLLLRSDGTSVYMTQDLGTAQQRYEMFHPSSMIYVVGNEQNYHFDVLRRVLSKLGKNYAPAILHLSYGMVELPEGKMKSREGTVVDADDLMDEMCETAEKTTRELGKADDMPAGEAHSLFQVIGMGALKYFILKVDPKKNMLFDPAESIDFNGNTGPFIQYTFARIQSLIDRSRGLEHNVTFAKTDDPLPLLPSEKECIRRLYQFPDAVVSAGREMSPAVIANYVYDLAKGYNQLYQELPVLKEEIGEKAFLRVLITRFTGNVIREAMRLLGIDVPQRM